ncbi:MAG: N-acetylglucosamine-6-phosphate deacetylase [Paraglaciecola sp.]
MKLHQPNQGWLEDYVVIVKNKIIEAIVPLSDTHSSIPLHDLGGAYLTPGFFDTQVNGGGGVLFNDETNVEGIAKIFDAHLQFGTTAILPTLISDDLSKVSTALASIDSAIEAGEVGIHGVHIEGPFINPQRKGIHNQDKFRLLDKDSVKLLSSLKHGKLLLTVAPELQNLAHLTSLAEEGVIVAAGHTAATYPQMVAALRSNVTCFTHLFNAMTPLATREPGVVGAALEDINSWVGVIVDGHHVHDSTLKIALAVKPKGKVFLVTDAMSTVGDDKNWFTLDGQTITCNGGMCASEEGTLAGSCLDMLSAVKNTTVRLGVSFHEAVNMASLYPAQMMGLDHAIGSIEVGKEASMLAIDSELSITRIWVNGALRSR